MPTRLAGWRKDIAGGAVASIISLPVCLASDVLAFAPLGPSYAATGAAAGRRGPRASSHRHKAAEQPGARDGVEPAPDIGTPAQSELIAVAKGCVQSPASSAIFDLGAASIQYR
jgi:hypothetical protein